MSDIYYTIEGAGESQYKEKMSRFLSLQFLCRMPRRRRGRSSGFRTVFMMRVMYVGHT